MKNPAMQDTTTATRFSAPWRGGSRGELHNPPALAPTNPAPGSITAVRTDLSGRAPFGLALKYADLDFRHVGPTTPPIDQIL